MDTFQNVLKKAQQKGHIDPRLIPWDNPQGGASKSKFSISQNIQLPPQLMMLDDQVIHDFQKTIENIHIAAETKSIQIIGISSAVQGQGTSTVTAILALLMAAVGKADFKPSKGLVVKTKAAVELPKPGVLCIDAQLRHPSLHSKFAVKQAGGFTEIVEEKITFRQGIKKINHSDVKFVSVGENKNFHLTPRLTEKLKTYLNILKTKIQFIVLDIPPLLQYSEGIALSKLCDGIILVTEAGETRWEVVQQAKRLLDRANVNIIGGVLNRRKYYISDWVYKNL